MINQDTIQRIFETAEITDVVSDFVSLKKRGVNYLGLCPFHNEKTPSFTVAPSKGIFKCFGCGKGGNAVTFVMEHENMTYPEALKYLAAKYSIEIEEREQTAEEIKAKNDRESILIVNSFAKKYFETNLHQHSEGKNIGLSYFRERGFRPDIIKKFGLGYSLQQRNALTETALKRGYQKEYLEKAGLTIVRNEQEYDRFFGRVIFPVHNLAGKVIAFAGRALKLTERTAKYLNSPGTLAYNKSRVLYGMYLAKKSITKNDRCYLVEGYTDVISMHQSGVENVVASSGTSLTKEQIRLIKRFTPNITILYDGDAAGVKASLRGIDMVLEEEMNVKILLLPEGEDPDTFAKSRSSSELLKFIEDNQQDFIVFKSRLLRDEAQNDPIKQAAIVSDIVRSIAVIPSGVVRTFYIRETSAILNVREEVLYDEVNKIRLSKLDKVRKRATQKKEAKAKELQQTPLQLSDSEVIERFEREIARLLLNYGQETLFAPGHEDYPYEEDDENSGEVVSVARYIVETITEEKDVLEFRNPLYRTIFDVYANPPETETGALDEKFFISHNDTEISTLAVDLLTASHQLSNFWFRDDNHIKVDEIDLKTAVPRILLAYKDRRILALIDQLQEDIKQTNDMEAQYEIMKKLMRLKEISKLFAIELGERTIVK